MPHQCLKCGKIFEEGSIQLLKGCPVCNGNRFFYTKEPLDEIQRHKIMEQVGEDINSAIMKLMNLESKETAVGKSEIKTKDIKKILDKEITDKNLEGKEKDKYGLDEHKRKATEEIEELEKDSPETIEIERPGSYKIDIKGLLEKEPIIIEKDGSYTIHLASVFKMLEKENKD